MDAKKIAESILAKLNLPEDLSGRVVNVVGFPDEATCRAFYPGRSQSVHEHACAVVKMEVRKRHGDVCRTIVPLLKADRVHSKEQRTATADRNNYLVPVSGSVCLLCGR
jgi:hypothetical protein